MAVEFTGMHLLFSPISYTVTYPLENRKFKGFGFYMKNVFGKNLKATAKYFFLPESLLARFAPPWIQFPAILFSRALYTVTWGSRSARIIDPYIYEQNKIRGESIYDLGKEYGIIPGEGRGKPVYVPDPEAYKTPKESLADKIKNGYDKAKDKVSHLNLNPFNNYQLQPAFANSYR